MKNLIKYIIAYIKNPLECEQYFTFTKRIGSVDRSWIGDTCRVVKKEGAFIQFEVYSPFMQDWSLVSTMYRPGIDFEFQLVSKP